MESPKILAFCSRTFRAFAELEPYSLSSQGLSSGAQKAKEGSLTVQR